jgi:hypothetical protein
MILTAEEGPQSTTCGTDSRRKDLCTIDGTTRVPAETEENAEEEQEEDPEPIGDDVGSTAIYRDQCH